MATGKGKLEALQKKRERKTAAYTKGGGFSKYAIKVAKRKKVNDGMPWPLNERWS